MKHLTIAARLNIMVALPLAMLLAISVLAGFGLRMDRDALKEVYAESDTSRTIGSIVTDMYRIRMALGNAIIADEQAEVASRVKNADGLMTEIMRKWNIYLDSGLTAQDKQAAEQAGIKPGELQLPMRLMLVGGKFGPPVFEIAAVLGEEETSRRIDRALSQL